MGDMGSVGDLRGSSSDLSKGKDDSSKPASFSSYLAMRTKSPGRPPPYSRTSSLPGYANNSNLNSIDEKESTSRTSLDTPSSPPTPKSILKEEPEERKQKRLDAANKMNSIKSSKLESTAEEKPPKPPYRIKDKPFSGTPLTSLSEEKPKRVIQALKEVKSEDADASYVIQLGKPKKDSASTKKVEIDLQPEVDRLQKENKDYEKQLNSMNEKIDQLEREKQELQTKRPRFGDLKKQTDISKLQQKVDEMHDEVKGKNKK